MATSLQQRLTIQTQLSHCSLIEWTFREFWQTYANKSQDWCAIVVRHSYDSCETFMRVSLTTFSECNFFSFSLLRQSRDICESVSGHSYECCLVLFSREIVLSCRMFSQDCHATVARHLYNVRTSVEKNCIVRHSYQSRKYFALYDIRTGGEKFLHCKFAKILRQVKRHSLERRAPILQRVCKHFG